MSRSFNVRSRYQELPKHVRQSIIERDLSGKPRSRNERARDKHEMRVVVDSILENTNDDDDWNWWL
jgi:hypothetical protein